MSWSVRVSLVVLILCAFGDVQGQGALSQTFLRRYNLDAMQGGLAITTAADGGFIATGQHQNNGSAGGCDVFVYKVDACGNREWFNLYGGAESEGGKSIEPTSDGGYIIGGSRATLVGVDSFGNNITEDQGFVMKIAGDGTLEWYSFLADVAWIFDVQPLASGFIAVGQASGRPVLVRLDDTGGVLWAKRYPSLSENALTVAPLADGGFFFVANQPLSGRDVEVARVDALGNPMWMKSFGAGFDPNEHIAWGCNALVQENEGVAYVMGPTTSGGIGGEDILLMKLNLDTGAPVWSRAYGSLGDDLGRDLIFVPGGIAFLGSSDGFGGTLAEHPDALSQSMEEQDIFLAKMNASGFVNWAQSYGGNERDKAVGVRYDNELGYTISAYTSSGVFGNEGGSMDPLFIRADFQGMVSCQNIPVNMISVPVSVSVGDLSNSEPFATSSFSASVTVSAFEPEDVYQCQECFNEPEFDFNATDFCVGDTLTLVNSTQVGLRCQQLWELQGTVSGAELLPGTEDTLKLVFDQPGILAVALTSQCSGAVSWTAEFEWHEVEAAAFSPDTYNGFEVSCAGASDGSITEAAVGGFLEGGGYEWQWQTSNEVPVDTSGLSAGSYKGVVTDMIGCTDTIEVVLTAPSELSVMATAVSDFNGYAVRCFDSEDGVVSLDANGGIPNYAFPAENGAASSDTLSGLSAGLNVFTVVDANGCTAQDTVILSSPSPPLLVLNAEADTCLSGQGMLRADFGVDVPPATVIWPDGFGQPDALTAFSELQTGLESGVYEVELLDGNGCLTTLQSEVTATYPAEVSFITGPAEVCFPGADVEFLDLTADEVSFRRWDFGDGSAASVTGEFEEATHTYLSAGSFEVELSVINDEGCLSSATEVVEVNDGMSVYVPTAFTPDNDGLNDGFGPVMTGVESFSMWVYNRWGDPVFETDEPELWWNGSPDNAGRSSKTEMFAWRIEAEGTCDAFEVYTGTVVVLR